MKNGWTRNEVIALLTLILTFLAAFMQQEVRCFLRLQSDACSFSGTSSSSETKVSQSPQSSIAAEAIPDASPIATKASPDEDKTWTVVLQNTLWEEVPGSYSETLGGSNHVNINGLVKNGDLVIFDMLDAHGAYVRLEVGCSTRSWQLLRQGQYQSDPEVPNQIEVKYRLLNDPPRIATPVQFDTLNYVCQIALQS